MFLIYFLAIVPNLIFGTLPLIKLKRDTSTLSFFIFSLVTSLWLLSNAIFCTTNIILCTRIGLAFAAIIPLSSLIFILHFPKSSHWPPIKQQLLSLPTLIVIILSFLPSTIDYGIKENSIHYGPTFYIYLAYFTSYSFLNFWILIKNSRHFKGKNKLKVKYIGIAWLFFITCSVVNTFLLPMMGEVAFNKLSPLCSTLLILIISYSMLTYKLIDLSILFGKCLSFSLSATLFIFLYISALKLGGCIYKSHIIAIAPYKHRQFTIHWIFLRKN